MSAPEWKEAGGPERQDTSGGLGEQEARRVGESVQDLSKIVYQLKITQEAMLEMIERLAERLTMLERGVGLRR